MRDTTELALGLVETVVPKEDRNTVRNEIQKLSEDETQFQDSQRGILAVVADIATLGMLIWEISKVVKAAKNTNPKERLVARTYEVFSTQKVVDDLYLRKIISSAADRKQEDL